MLSVEPSAIMIQPKTTLRTLPAPSDAVFPGLYAWSPISTTNFTTALSIDPGAWNTWRNRRITPEPLPGPWFRRASGGPLFYRVDSILTWLAARRGERLDTLDTWQHSLRNKLDEDVSDPARVREQARYWAEIAGPRVGDARFTPAGFDAYLLSFRAV